MKTALTETQALAQRIKANDALRSYGSEPIMVTALMGGDGEVMGYGLNAGRARVRAYKSLGIEEIPGIIMGDAPADMSHPVMLPIAKIFCD